MKKHRRISLSGRTLLAVVLGVAVVVAVLAVTVPSASARIVLDRDGNPWEERDYCRNCHYGAGGIIMPLVVDSWLDSNHADSNHGFNANTYCAKCHAPFEADPTATHSDNSPVPADEWEDVTCGACHPPHNLRVAWGTPIGNYVVETGEWEPVYGDDPETSDVDGSTNPLCTYCHTGSRHEKDFQGFGDVMYHKKNVECIDCHMPKKPTGEVYPAGHEREGEEIWLHSHDFGVDPVYSCGTNPGGCHDNHKTEWAVKQIAKEKMHGKEKK